MAIANYGSHWPNKTGIKGEFTYRIIICDAQESCALITQGAVAVSGRKFRVLGPHGFFSL